MAKTARHFWRAACVSIAKSALPPAGAARAGLTLWRRLVAVDGDGFAVSGFVHLWLCHISRGPFRPTALRLGCRRFALRHFDSYGFGSRWCGGDLGSGLTAAALGFCRGIFGRRLNGHVCDWLSRFRRLGLAAPAFRRFGLQRCASVVRIAARSIGDQ